MFLPSLLFTASLSPPPFHYSLLYSFLFISIFYIWYPAQGLKHSRQSSTELQPQTWILIFKEDIQITDFHFLTVSLPKTMNLKGRFGFIGHWTWFTVYSSHCRYLKSVVTSAELSWFLDAPDWDDEVDTSEHFHVYKCTGCWDKIAHPLFHHCLVSP